MAKGEFSILKTLLVFETLRLNSDSEHTMTAKEIIEKIDEAGIDVGIDRKAVYNSVDKINEYYINSGKGEIICSAGKNPLKYYFNRRELNENEIRFLLDAVQSASFITKEMSDDLCDSLSRLATGSQAESLMSNTIRFATTKHSNKKVFDYIGEINKALNKGNQVEFKYFNLGLNKQMQLKRGGEFYEVNPIGLIFNNGYYYLECYNDTAKEEKDKLITYRIDRMTDCKMSDNAVASQCIKEFFEGSNDRFTTKDRLTAFSMWHGDKTQVCIRTGINNLGDIYDKFGEDVDAKLWKKDTTGQTITVTVNVNLSDVFYGWVASYGGDMEIADPPPVRDIFKAKLEAALQRYK